MVKIIAETDKTVTISLKDYKKLKKQAAALYKLDPEFLKEMGILKDENNQIKKV